MTADPELSADDENEKNDRKSPKSSSKTKSKKTDEKGRKKNKRVPVVPPVDIYVDPEEVTFISSIDLPKCLRRESDMNYAAIKSEDKSRKKKSKRVPVVPPTDIHVDPEEVERISAIDLPKCLRRKSDMDYDITKSSNTDRRKKKDKSQIIEEASSKERSRSHSPKSKNKKKKKKDKKFRSLSPKRSRENTKKKKDNEVPQVDDDR